MQDREAHPTEKRPRADHDTKSKLALPLLILIWVVGILVLFVGIYKVSTWVDNYQFTRLYTRGKYTPLVNTLELDDGRLGHAIIFYGEDGDTIFLSEINRSLSICGGFARLEIADSDWFSGDVEDYSYAEITFVPLLIKQDGTQRKLPAMTLTIDVPVSPLTITSPTDSYTSVVTSTATISLKAVVGSDVYINGEDVSSSLERNGELSVTVAVEPIGENVYTVIVRTPRHKENRSDVVIYREAYEIEIELDADVATTSNTDTMRISGKCELGASITVDTDYLEESFVMDRETGEFAFLAKFSQLGNNLVHFRATKDGKADAVISFNVYYTPSLAAYSDQAWKMDYDQLKKYYESWVGRVFLCSGTVTDILYEDGTQYIVMDVNPGGEEQLIILENLTDSSPTKGTSCKYYADVSGRHYYNEHYYPMLAARYQKVDT